ncbi:MAG: hypothetical protein J6M23_00520 [Bacteroidales bacterium]|nr:hypothetical protein [Bacteroidales bacterium]MBQ9194689.1 hypothetical protein [Bacteroidales bacterium]
MSRRKPIGRTSFNVQNPLSRHLHACCASVAIISAFLQVPAFFSSCKRYSEYTEHPTESRIYIKWTKNPTPDAIDLFFFETGGAQKLDSYQQLRDLQGESRHYGLSGPGPKRLVVLSAREGVTDSWLDIQNYGSICKKTWRIEEEELSEPHLVAEALVEDGASRLTQLNLQPMLTEVRLSSLKADFSGRPYAGKSFTCSRIYLSYAATEYKPIGPEGGHPVSWINPGPLDSLATEALPHPEWMLKEGSSALPLSFFCYANPASNASIPRTRLVIEGNLDGVPCYYPVEIPDLAPARVYDLRLTLRRMGSPDPDIPTESGTVLVQINPLPWDVPEAYTVTY